MKRLFVTSSVLLFIISLFVSSCSQDSLPAPEPPIEPEFCDTLQATYDADVKLIIDNSCAYSGCHASSAVIGDFTTYANLKEDLDNGKFTNRALELKDMPPTYATGPKELSAEELEILQCWMDDAYPEN